MSLQPENPSPAGSPETRPLWIIAISLAAIALCLVLITIRIQLDRWKAAAVKETDTGPVEVSIRKPDRPTVQRRNFEPPKPEIPAVETTPSTPTVSTPMTNSESVLPELVSTYGGGFAATVSSLPSTNAGAMIVGRVTLRGTPPPVEPTIDESMRPPCLNQSSNALMNPVFKVSDEGGLSEVIVAITAGLGGGHFPRPNTNHLWTFTNCQVYPSISVVRTGQRVSFGGANPPHFIQFSGTKVRSPLPVTSARVNLSALPQSTNELVQLKCLQHPWETAHFAQFDHPFFAITDTNGNFAIPRVPAGTYTLQAMHRGLAGASRITQAVSVREHETAVVNLLIDAPRKELSTQNLSAQR